MNKLLVVLFGVVLLLILCTVSASALEKQVNITVVTVLPANATLETIKVDGITYGCTNNICPVYVSYDCPACPACPAINYTDLQANILSYISASKEELKKCIIEHNSSPDFKRADIEALLADDDEAGKIQDFIQNTVMVKDSDYKNMTEERDYWHEEWTNLNASYAIENERRLAAEKDNERLSNYMKYITMSIFLCLGFVLLFVKLDLSSTISSISSRFVKSREGLLPEEREMQTLNEREKKLAFAVERGKKLAKTKELEEELKSMGFTGLESGEELIVGEKKAVAESADEVEAGITEPELVVTPPSNSEITGVVRAFIKSRLGYSYITKELYEHCKEKNIIDEKTISSIAFNIRNEIKKTEGGSWVQKRIFSDGKLTVLHEYTKPQTEERGGDE